MFIISIKLKYHQFTELPFQTFLVVHTEVGSGEEEKKEREKKEVFLGLRQGFKEDYQMHYHYPSSEASYLRERKTLFFGY